jgi:hypothetical protein
VPEPPRAQDDATEILTNGWRQGSIAPTDLADALREDERREIPGDSLLVIASHDCDVTNPSFGVEPDVEFLVARSVPQINGTLTRGKNPRRLHLELITRDGLRPFEMAAGDRFRTSRRRLLDRRPWEGHSLRPQDRRLLAQWLAKRYDRTALPAAFDARWKSAREKIRRLLDRTGHFVDGVFLTVEDRELAQEENYLIVVRGVISVDNSEDPGKRAQAQQCVDGLAALLATCTGIEVLDSALVREDEFTLHDIARSKYWDWEWLSGDDG